MSDSIRALCDFESTDWPWI